MKDRDDIDHEDILSQLHELEKQDGWDVLVAHFDAKLADLGARILDSIPDDRLVQERALHRRITEEFSPTAILETLKTTHREGAKKQTPVVPRPNR